MLFRRFALVLLFLLLVTAIGITARYTPNWAWVVDHEQSLRESVLAKPLLSWCVGVGLAR